MTQAPFFDDIARAPKGAKSHWRSCSDGVRVRITTWSGGNKGTVLILPGRTEFIEKYGPTVTEFLNRGHSVAVIDWRGQGLSDRIAKNHQLGHVKNFSDYQLDIAQMLDVVKSEDMPKPSILLAHSMGGCIALRALHNGLEIDKVIFSAPMWGIYIEPLLRFPAKLIAKIGPKIGLSKKFSPNTSPENYVQINPFDGNTLTNDPEIYAWLTSQLEAHPELGIGGPSLKWLQQAFSETSKLRKTPAPTTDCLCLLGTKEAIVSPHAITKIMTDWDNSKLVTLAGAQHEIFMEEKHVQDQAWAEVDAFLAV